MAYGEFLEASEDKPFVARVTLVARCFLPLPLKQVVISRPRTRMLSIDDAILACLRAKFLPSFDLDDRRRGYPREDDSKGRNI